MSVAEMRSEYLEHHELSEAQGSHSAGGVFCLPATDGQARSCRHIINCQIIAIQSSYARLPEGR